MKELALSLGRAPPRPQGITPVAPHPLAQQLRLSGSGGDRYLRGAKSSSSLGARGRTRSEHQGCLRIDFGHRSLADLRTLGSPPFTLESPAIIRIRKAHSARCGYSSRAYAWRRAREN
jgi:hypothetical protein